MDTNKDGYISVSEFKAAVSLEVTREDDELIEQVFKQLDIDKSGKLS